MKGKDNTYKDVVVRRDRVENALNWLIQHNPQYQDIQINTDSLEALPVNGVPLDLQTIETNTAPDNLEGENDDNNKDEE